MTYQSPSSFIIGGHPRSGTTLLAELCNSHPDIGVTFEYRSFRNIGKRYSEYRRHLRRDFVQRPILREPGKYRRIVKSFLLHYRFTRSVRKYADHQVNLQAVVRAYGDVFQRSVVGDKWPAYIFNLQALTSLADLKRIIIYRDCRDVALSAVKMATTAWPDDRLGGQLDTVQKATMRWVEAMRQLEEYEDNVHTIRYETLVQQPQQTLTRLGEYLQVDPGEFQSQMIHSRSVGKHKGELSEEQLKQIETIAGSLLEKYGYL